MKGELIYKILDFLEDRSMATTDFFAGFLAAGYGASLGKMEYQHRIRDEARHSYQIDREKKRNLQKYIYKLKSQGLISENTKGEIIISSKGKKKLALIKGNKLIDKKGYKKQIASEVIIVSYDIPLAFNRERNILRDILKLLGFQAVHQSVWVGKVKLPQKLITDLERLGILDYIEILQVSKTGSLKSI